jgi:hypothetical protein
MWGNAPGATRGFHRQLSYAAAKQRCRSAVCRLLDAFDNNVGGVSAAQHPAIFACWRLSNELALRPINSAAALAWRRWRDHHTPNPAPSLPQGFGRPGCPARSRAGGARRTAAVQPTGKLPRPLVICTRGAHPAPTPHCLSRQDRRGRVAGLAAANTASAPVDT